MQYEFQMTGLRRAVSFRVQLPLLMMAACSPMTQRTAERLSAGGAFAPSVRTSAPRSVGNYRVFEATVINSRPYRNRFSDVELLVDYVAPSGRLRRFRGFFDGDGKGGGSRSNGNVWKMRFMPDEVGRWRYTWFWSDGSPGGQGRFESTEKNSGKGVIRPYRGNPHWFAYNGTNPVWLKSYYETGHGGIAQDFDWMTENVFRPLINHGYNHLQVNWLMSLCCFRQYYADGPAPSSLDLTLYQNGKASSTMNLGVWHLMERRMAWLNARDVGVHMFLGFDGGRNDGPQWGDLTPEEKDFYVKYAVARLGPFANLAGWNFVWEVEGNAKANELRLAELLMKYDIFEHLRTYEDEAPRSHNYDNPAYTFAAVENHRIAAPSKSMERYNYWRTAWTHYMAALVSYSGKPVFMSEGNALWRRYWHKRSGATQDDLRQSAWATVMAGASFTWNGHSSEDGLYAHGPNGLPFGDDNVFSLSERYVEILTQVMTNEVAFHRLAPQSDQLTAHDPFRVFALVEEGRQYLVFSMNGEPFSVFVDVGEYANNIWVDAKSGIRRPVSAVTGNGSLRISSTGTRIRSEWPRPVSFVPPTRSSDWVLILRKTKPQP